MSYDYCPQFQKCPRCGVRAYESFKTHDCCHECNYSSDFDYSKERNDVPQWALDAAEDHEEGSNFDEQNEDQDNKEAA